MRAVKPARPVSKRERAEQTRARIIEAAYRLFTQNGYEATTMQAVADQACVAVQTVYFTFHTKARLLMTIESRAVGGDDQEGREQQQRELVEERDPRNVVALWVAASATMLNRITAFVALLGANLQMDAESVERRARERDRWFQLLIDRLVALDALKAGLVPSRALDVARAVTSLEAYADLTRRRGWTEQEWIGWMTGVLASELLDGRHETQPHGTPHAKR